MNILLIGCGSIGKRHIASLQMLVQQPKFYIMRATHSQDKFTQEISAIIVKDWDEINEPLDLVVIANPPAFHQQYIQKAIESNLPVYIEKPLVTSFSDLCLIKQQLLKFDYQQPTLMGCNLRFLPSIIELKSQLDKGTIGNICRAIFEVGQYLPQWRPQQDYRRSYSALTSMGGGVVYDLVHELDLVRYLLGEFTVISSEYQHLSHLELDVEDTAVIHLGRDKGPLVSVHLDYVSRFPTRSIKVVGDEGSLIWDLIAQKLELRHEKGIINLVQNDNGFNVDHTYVRAMEQLIKAIKTKSSTSPCIAEGICTAELMLACKPG